MLDFSLLGLFERMKTYLSIRYYFSPRKESTLNLRGSFYFLDVSLLRSYSSLSLEASSQQQLISINNYILVLPIIFFIKAKP
jgi:hypothetical protein